MVYQRKYYSGNDFRRALSIDELRSLARRCLPNFAFEYIEGGAEDEQTLGWNRKALDAIHITPATLVDTSSRTQKTRVFGDPVESPLIIAPTGLNGLLSYRGDISLARAAANAGIPYCLSTVSNVRLEDVASEVGGRLWMQLYIMSDRKIANNIVERADAAGYEALVFTTDANVFGYREWDRRNYRKPGNLTLRNLLDVMLHPRWMINILSHGIPRFENIIKFMPPEAQTVRGGVAFVPRLFAPDISWNDVAWLRDKWPRKLILKGILNVSDAQRAADLGCDGIVLSNHGGRQLDSCIAPIEILPKVVRTVGDRLSIFIDSGFRRGTDIIKAMALGATAVMIGRPTLYGLAVGGEDGVRHALEILTTEIDRVLGQTGCVSIADLHPNMLNYPET